MGAGSSQKQFHTTKHSEALTLLSYSTSLSVSSYIPGRFQQISETWLTDVHVSLLLLSGFLWLVGLRRSRGICSFFEPELSSIEVRNGWWGWWGWEGGGESGCTLLRSRAMLIFMWKGYSCSVALKKLFMLYSNADPRGHTHTHRGVTVIGSWVQMLTTDLLLLLRHFYFPALLQWLKMNSKSNC